MEITQRLSSLETRLSQIEFAFNRKQSSFVTLSGDQNINGEKSFNDVITFKKGLILQTDLTVISNPTIYLGSSATADTQASIDNSNKLATTAFVQNLIEEIGGGGSGATTLNGLSDVTLTLPLANQILKYNGSIWINSTLSSSNLSDGSDLVKTTDYTASDVLTKLLTVDGSGSSLDADLLDGSHKTDFLLKADNLSGLSSTSTARSNLGLGSASTYNVGTSANNIVQLNGSSQIPAIDGSLITGITATQVSGISGTYAPLASPALTGTPTAPTAILGDTTTKIATTEFVQNNAINAVKYALEHGYSLDIIGGDIDITQGSVSLGSNATATTPIANDNSTKVATTAYVQTELSAMVLDDLFDVVITGTPSNNQVLKYDTGTSKWINGTSSGSVASLDDLSDVSIDAGALVAGQILRYNGAVFLNTRLSSSDMFDTSSIVYKIDNLSGLSDPATARSNIGASSQTEVNNIESSIGGFVDADGVWVTGGGITTNYLGSATSLTDALDKLDNQIYTVAGSVSTTLDGLTDVTLGTLSTGQVLKYNGSVWINDNAGGGGGDVYLANNNTFTGDNTFNGAYLLVESVAGEDKFKVDNVADTIDMFTPASLSDAYIYVKFDFRSGMDDFFYVFTSPDGGETRQVIPLTLIQDSGTHYLQKITSFMSGGTTYTFDYSVYKANGFSQYTNPNDTPNASFKRDPNLTYYISSWNRVQDGNPDFALAVSDSNDGLGLSYVDLAGSGMDNNVVETTYEIIANVPTSNSLTTSTYLYDTRTTSLANFDKASDLTTLTRLDVDTYAVINKLVVNSTVTLNGAIALGSSATATTQSANDNSTKVATTAYVQTELSAMVLNDLSDVTVSSQVTGQTLRYNGSAFVNSKLASTDLSDISNIPLLNANNEFTGNIKSYGGNISVYDGLNVSTQTAYVFVKYNSTSRNDLEYFYIFKTSDGGVTRESVDLVLLQDSGTDYLEEDTTQGYKRYIASQASAYTNGSTVANASLVLDQNATYYFTIRTDNDNTSPNKDFQIYLSTNQFATGFTYNDVLPYGGGFSSEDNPYTLVLDNSSWSYASLATPTSITDASALVNPTQVLSVDNDTGNIISNGYIQLKKQINHPSTVADHAHVYAKVDVLDTEIYVQDSGGNNTRLSSHNEEGEWEYYSFNKKTGKAIRINMEKMIRTLESLTGEKFIIEE